MLFRTGLALTSFNCSLTDGFNLFQKRLVLLLRQHFTDERSEHAYIIT